MLRDIFVLMRRHPVVAGLILLGAACGILRMRGRPNLLAKALGQLTPEQQRVIYLRFVGDLTTSEIALIVDRREDDVRLLQLRAFRSLLRVLANQ